MKRLYIIMVLSVFASSWAVAQDWMKIHRTYNDVPWSIPLQVSKGPNFELDEAEGIFYGNYLRKDGSEIQVPYTIDYIDSITFAPDLTDEEKGHNRFRTFAMYIDTYAQSVIDTKEEWLPCHISVDGRGEYSDYSGTARIKGRGNSSWEWYDKKPYKFKLEEKSKLLGLDKAKDWNLMANYRDVTDLMNAFAFETARYMGMPHTNHTRFVEVFLNGDYVGLYQLTEKIEVDDNRVNISKEHGVLLTFDADDGPNLSPTETNNFWSKVYSMPMAVKHPDEPSAEQVEQIKQDFAVLETAVRAHDYALVDSLMDIGSFIGILQLHEYLYNVEIDAPRSLYMYRDSVGKYTFGPVWDWDAGFDFDWGNMYTGHDFFSNSRELIFGTDPINHKGASYHVPEFFTDMFANKSFVSRYKEAWTKVSDSIYIHPWKEMEQFVAELNKGAYSRDLERWPLSGKDVATEIKKMSSWLQSRKTYLDGVIAGYPAGTDGVVSSTVNIVGSLTVNVSMAYSAGYSQGMTIDIPSSDVGRILGEGSLGSLQLKALNADGTVGSNTAAGTYGAWFGDDGGVSAYASGHVYIESDDLFSWNFGCHPENCARGDEHTVVMQYRYDDGTEIKALNVNVVCRIGTSTSVSSVEEDSGNGGQSGFTLLGTIDKSVELTFSKGYHQDGSIEIENTELTKYFTETEVSSLTLVPLNADGTEGTNTAGKTYGAWFDANGNTNPWAQGHVFMESHDMFSWAYGCHPDNCAAGDKHTATMQYRYVSGGSTKAVNVKVSFVVK